MALLKQCCFVSVLMIFSACANAVEVRFFADEDDGTYQAQNSATRNIDCVAPATCDVATGRYRLIGFNNEHSVWVTVEEAGSVRYTYRNPREVFPFAVAANAAATPVSSPSPTPAPVTTSPPVNNPSNGYVPLAPQNFRVEVYSSTALELFWNHASDFASQGVSYTLTQDGQTITQSHTGNSWFVSNLEPGRTYRYQIAAIAPSSNSSGFRDAIATTAGDAQQVSSGSPSSPSTPTVPSPSNDVSSNLSAPANVVASVYSETAAEVFWDRSESSSSSFISYEVFLDGVSVATTQGSSYFFDNLTSGSDYSIRIDANAGSLTRSSNEVSITTPGAFRLTPVGRPAQDSNTDGFGFWDNMTFEEQQQWPSDCLFAGNQFSSIEFGGVPNVCFSPFRRELMHISNFRYSLPGDNATNHVEVIEWLSANSIALVADITTQFGQSRFELSVFEQSGEFVYTTPILQSIVNPPNSSITRGINLDGKDLRDIRDPWIRFAPLNPNVYVIGEYYEPSGSGNLNNLSGWVNRGSFAQKINTSSREVLSEVLFEGRTQESITPDDLPDFGIQEL